MKKTVKRIAVFLLTFVMTFSAVLPVQAQDAHDHSEDELLFDHVHDEACGHAESDLLSEDSFFYSNDFDISNVDDNEPVSSEPINVPDEAIPDISSSFVETETEDSQTSGAETSESIVDEEADKEESGSEQDEELEEEVDEVVFSESYAAFFAERHAFEWHMMPRDCDYVWSTIGGFTVKDKTSGHVALVAGDVSSYWLGDGFVLYAENGNLYHNEIDGTNPRLLYEGTDIIEHVVGDLNVVFFIANGTLYRLHIESLIVDELTYISSLMNLYPIDNHSVVWTVMSNMTDILNEIEHGNDIMEMYLFDSLSNEITNVSNSDYLSAYTQAELSAYEVTFSSSELQTNNFLDAASIGILAEYKVDGTHFFSTTGKACTCHSNGCTYTSRVPNCTCKIFQNAIQCHGFGKYVYNSWYGHEMTDCYKNYSFSGSNAEEKWKNLPVGALVRASGTHTIMILSKTADSMTTYEANTGARDCKVFSRTKTYAEWAKEYPSPVYWAVDSAVNHNYAAATCTSAKKCNTCGATSGSALSHSYSNATCTAAKKCTRCGVTSGSALGHNYANATCTAAKKCTRCNATTGSALGHNYANATCTTAKKCTRCNVTTGAALGHNYTVLVNTINSPTCVNSGLGTYKCSRCTATTTKQIAAYGHNYAAATCTSPKKCTRCGATSGTALGHSYSNATCTAAKKCTRCGATSGSALGHNYTNATCTTPKKCTRCSATTGSALGHNYAAATCTSAKKCTRCGSTTGSSLGHNFTVLTNTISSATCTNSGLGQYKCSRCTATTTKTIAARGHSYTVAATCTTAKKCSRCNSTTGSALGHSYTVAATCTRAKKCSRCTATTGSALGHNYVKVATVRSATCTSTGQDRYRCSRCGGEQLRTVPVAAHQYVYETTTKRYKCKKCGRYK